MKRISIKLLFTCAVAYVLGATSLSAQNANFVAGDLVLYFQKFGDGDTVYANIGNAATLYRGTAAGPGASDRVNFLDINTALTSAFGVDWASDPDVYAGLAGVWGFSNTNSALQDGDPHRTLYVSNSRTAVGTVGQPSSGAWDLVTAGTGAMTSAATNIFTQNNVLEVSFDEAVEAVATAASQIDNQNPFVNQDIQDTGYNTFAGGVQQRGTTGSFGSFGAAGSVEFALDLYRILARNNIAGQVAGDLRIGSYEGTVTINSSGMVSFVSQESGPVDVAAAITTPPASVTINSGETTTLSVTASGTAPLTYQWYQGTSGTTTTPVGTNSDSFTTPALTSTTSYWVKVTNAANSTGTDSSTATVTVNLPTVGVAVTPSSVLEDGASNLVYTFTRSGATTSSLTANFTVGGTATFSSDYAQVGAASFGSTSGTVTFSAGSSTATVTLDPTVDSTVESDETAILTVTASTGYTAGSPADATGTISDDDVTVSVAVAPSSVLEDGATNLVYTFTRNGNTSASLTANFTVGGTATLSSDYAQTGAASFGSTSGTVTFAAGSSTTTVTLDPTVDSTVESDETAILTVTAATGYTAGSPATATGTISNDDSPTVSVAVVPSSVLEDGATNLVYTFTRNGDTTASLTANFTVGGTATLSSDYVQSGAASFGSTSGTVTFAAGSSTATVTLDPTVDSTVESDETAILTVTASTGYTAGSPADATGTISDDDVTVSVAVAPSSVLEDGATNLVYTFTRNGNTSASLTANFTVGGSATFSSDYAQSGAASFGSSSGTVTFAAGSASATVTLDPTVDSTVESDETAILTVTAATGYTAGSPATATGTISNDDSPTVSVAVAPSSVLEDGSSNLVYTFTRNGDTSASLTANFTVGGSATFSSDYAQSGAASFGSSSGTVTFAAGSASATVTLDPTVDSTVESDETAILTVSAATGYTAGSPATATGTISNDDSPTVSVAIAPSSVLEDGATNLVYTFTRNGDTAASLTANFAVSGSATFSSDYAQSGAASFGSTSGTVTFAADSSTTMVTLDPTVDSTVESDETAILTVTAATGYTAGSPATATGTISNDDSPTVSVAVAPASVLEDGAGHLVYTFTRNGDTTASLTANFTVGGTANFSSDYAQVGAASFGSTSGTVTFAAGSSTATVTLDPTVDSTVESDETVILTVTASTGYTVGSPATATGTISNDDSPTVSVAVAPSSVLEDGSSNLVYTFTRNGDTTASLTANFAVSGSATFSNDYAQSGAASFGSTSGSVTFAAGSSTATVTLDPTVDSTVESDETAILTVTAATGYTAGSPATATGTISNDDSPTVSVAVAPSSVLEDGATNLVYTFTRNGNTTASLTANFAVSGSATFSSDYAQSGAASFGSTSGTVTFAAGSATATVTLDPTVDSTVESDETAILTVTASTGYTAGSPATATGTISNDDSPTVSVAIAPTSVLEDGATNLVYTFTRNGDTTASLTANFTVGGTANFTNDYAQTGSASFGSTSGTVTFAAGLSTATVTLDPTVDSTVESDETAVLTVTASTGYTAGSPATATGTISNDDSPTVSVAIAPTSVLEDGATNLVYTFTRNGDTTASLTANFTVGGTANFTNDYAQTGSASFGSTSGTVTFAAGLSTATVTLDPTVDSTVESDETAVLTVTAATGYTAGSPATATGTISNDDSPTVSVAVAPASVLEDGATNLVYTFTRNGDTTASLTANFTVGGTATLSSDYVQSGAASFGSTSGTVTFAAGSATATVTLDPTVDSTVESDETAILTVTASTGYTAGSPATATGTISNDDSPTVSVAIAPTSVLEDGATNLVYTFTRNGNTTASLTANFAVSGSATFSSDYAQSGAASFGSTSGTVTFAAGASTATLTLDPTVDSTVESDETAVLTVTAATGYTAGSPATATGTISNDDSPTVSVAVAPASVLEDGATNLVYTFTRNGNTTASLTANFAVSGSATFSSDYAQTGAASFGSTSGSVTFAAGASTATVTLDPTVDSTVESDETAILTVAASTGYTAGSPADATGTIGNDDATVSVAVASSSVLEDGATNLVYTFTRNGNTSASLTANFTVGGTASFSSDYAQSGAASFGSISGTVTFAAGASTATVTLDPKVDSTVESNETVVLTVSAATGYTAGSPATATGTISNDDSPTESDAIAYPDDSALPLIATPTLLSASNSGSYVGILTSTDGSQNLGYFKSLKLSNKGTFSASMIFEGVSYPIKGVFGSNGLYTGVVTKFGGSPATVNLQLVRTTGGAYKIEGIVNVGSQTADVSLVKPGNSTLYAGTYTLLIICDADEVLESQGYGHGLMKVTSIGGSTIKGVLGDGTKWTSKCSVTADGEMPIYYYGNAGSFAGMVRFRDLPGVSDCDTQVNWKKTESVSGLQCNLIGSRFQKSAGRLLSSVENQLHNVDMLIGEGSEFEAESLPFEWTIANKINYVGTDAFETKMSVNTSTGDLTGITTAEKWFKSGRLQKLIKSTETTISGVVFQKQNVAAGLMYVKGAQPRSLIIVPIESE